MESINKVKGYRVMVGLTQEEMAERIGVSSRTYKTKENSNGLFTINELSRIKEVLKSAGINVTIDELIN